jgi:hypothetical protein
MSIIEPAKERLREAIERLRSDIDRVEFWADALDGLAQPVPEYEARDLSRHLLPRDTNKDCLRASAAKAPRGH